MTTSIYAYTKHETEFVIVSASLPYSQNDESRCTELCTLDGTTYLAVPDSVTLPEQPDEIDLQLAVLTPELRSQIKANSVHCDLIAERMEKRIRDRYSLSDEQYFSRIGVGAALGSYTMESGEQEALMAFGAYVEAAREWGREERKKLGL